MVQVDPETPSVLALAQIGDAVYELMTRVALCEKFPAAGKLHREKTKYVNAVFQSRALEVIRPVLTEDELAVVKRGLNASPERVPKGAERREYRGATALETLFGHLYLRGRTERLSQLFDIIREMPPHE